MSTEDLNMYSESNIRYNSNTFGLGPHTKEYTIIVDTGLIPETHKNYLVYNIGRTTVYAKLKYGTKAMWYGVADETSIEPGGKKILNNGGKPYYVTGLKIYNNTDVKAVIHCATSDDEYFLYGNKEPRAFDETKNKLLKSIFALGVKYVPYIETGLSELVKAFWPTGKPNVWEEVQSKIEALVEQKIFEAISSLLDEIKLFRERMKVLSEEMRSGGKPENLKVHYMNIAQDLFGFAKKFIFADDTPNCQDLNQYVLPHYSTTVLMTISFYVIGINQAKMIGLTAENIASIKSYANRTINGANGANSYINELFENRLNCTYAKTIAEDLYDNMMNVRSLFVTQGLEYIRIWNYLFENLSDDGLYSDVVSYSTFFGRQTANLIQQCTVKKMTQPLTPALRNGKRIKISSIDVYIWRMDSGRGPARIGGVKIQFHNGGTYELGTKTEEISTVKFNGALLKKLEVYGRGAIDYIAFHFSDNRVDTVGEKDSEEHTVFELENHHIVSIFLASDNWHLAGQAANISVSYMLIDKPDE